MKRGKNDTADAEALCEAMSRPTMRLLRQVQLSGRRSFPFAFRFPELHAKFVAETQFNFPFLNFTPRSDPPIRELVFFRLCGCRCKSLEEIGTAYNSNKFAILEDWD